MRAVLVIAFILAAVCSTFACSSAPQVRFQPVPVKDSARFTREVLDKQAVTVQDGVAAVLILIDEYERARAFEEQLEVLIRHGAIERSDQAELKASDRLTRGRLAYLLTGALQMKGGLTSRIFGRSQRYALRECIDCGIIQKGSAGSVVSGWELVSVLANAESYAARKEGNR